MTDTLESILARRKETHKEVEQPGEDPGKFFGVLLGEGLFEQYLELRFKNGAYACLSYNELSWFNYSSKQGLIDLSFGSFAVSIVGRGMFPTLFNALKSKRVAWVKEADTDIQDDPEADCYIEAIYISVPKDFGEEEE